mgnify:CR=1 FL=1
MIGPITPEVVNPTEVIPNHFPLSMGFQREAITIQIVAITPANPIPCIALKKINIKIFVLNPQPKVDIENINKEGKITFFAPYLSFDFPITGTMIADVNEKLANTHE